ncbi:MAG: hypothetical protein R3321_14285 [Nitrososphaeraceae archaeon]|nr:hypothetical protein [Nitrososphaeraceae archaeon]
MQDQFPKKQSKKGLKVLLGLTAFLIVIAVVIANLNNSQTDIQYPFNQYSRGTYWIDKDGETNYGKRNIVQTYYITGEVTLDTMKHFASEKMKARLNNESLSDDNIIFDLYVLFDDSLNIEMPENVTRAYSMNDKARKHIKAIYMFNETNGFSELKYYEINSYESPAQIVEVK